MGQRTSTLRRLSASVGPQNAVGLYKVPSRRERNLRDKYGTHFQDHIWKAMEKEEREK